MATQAPKRTRTQVSESSPKPKSTVSVGRTIIHVLVGPEQNDFGIHKNLLCHYSPFFRAAFTSGFEETDTGIMKLPETDLSAFELFYEWLYSKNLWIETEPRENWPQVHVLVKLYIFADMARIPSLQNQIISVIESVSQKTSKIPVRSFPYVWKNSNEQSPIRRLLVDMMVWTASDGLLDKFARECEKDVVLEVMKAMRRQLLSSLNLTRDGIASPLEDIQKYYVDENA